MIFNKVFYVYGFLLFFCIQKNSSQEVQGEVNYTYSVNFSRPYENDFKLTFDSKNSIFQEILTKRNEEIEEEDTGNGIVRTLEVFNTSGQPDFYFYDLNNLYFRQNHLDEDLRVKEEPFTWDWNITNETKKLGAYHCTKAITTFRGRTYEAWFTNEIAVPFGPWKFHGLPGLILEIIEETNVLHIYATKLKLSNNNTAVMVDRKLFDNALSIKQYNERKLELLRESFRKLSARLPQGSAPLFLDENCNDCREEIEKF